MRGFVSGFVLPMLLLAAALFNWSLLSLADLLAFLFIQHSAPKNGLQSRRKSLVPWCTLTLSSLAILSNATFHIIWAIKGDDWSVAEAQWVNLVGFRSVQSWGSPSLPYFLVIHILAAFAAVIEVHRSRFDQDLWDSPEITIGSHLRVLCCLLLPGVQLVVGISHPSWASLPFFICSCIGLVNWSLTSNFLGLFQWWRYLFMYAGLNIFLLYVYQLPIEVSGTIECVAGFIGLYKIPARPELSEICSGLSLLLFYIMLSWIRCDLTEMNFIMSTRENNLNERLLPLKHSFFISETRSGVRNTNVLLRGAVFRTFSVNFFTYGFPISLFALSFWSFHFASLCAFGLLAYVGYILYAFPSLFHLHRLNGLLLVFILLWATSTYIFNVAFTVLNKKMWKDVEIWETIGLWHYPIPGFYLLAQFCLGVLVSLVNLVNNSVFLYLSDEDRELSNHDFVVEESEETKVLIVATITWGLRKSSRAIALLLIFLIALKPAGFIHSVYMIFFLMYLLSHSISREIRQSLVLLCEAHFAMLYILQLNLISEVLKQKFSFITELLSQLGFLSQTSTGDFLKIAALACICTIHNHGFEMLSSFSAVVQNTPCPPIGLTILRAGLIKSVLLSIHTSRPTQNHDNNSSHDKKIVSFLNAIGQKFLSVYRSCGTPIAFLTILLSVYQVRPNFISFGYLFFLLFWVIGRQLVGKTKKRLWLPLKVYAVVVFILIYGLSVFSSFRTWLSRMVDVSLAFAYKPEASILENIWVSLAVLIKILSLSLFYASLSPVSAFGFLYLVGLVVCSTLPKSSRSPSKLFIVYSGLLVMIEYLFQLLIDQDRILSGQNQSSLFLFLGLRLYKPSFLGLESGLRGKVLVIASCILQYNAFRWLEKRPCSFENVGKGEEPCALFGTSEKVSIETAESKLSTAAKVPSEKRKDTRCNSWPSLSTFDPQGPDTTSHGTGITESYMQKYLCISGSSRGGHKLNRKRIRILRKERLHMQIATLKVFLKFWIENMFNVYGLEINMIALLLASFSVLNFISLLYVASLATCILLPRGVVQKLWPKFVVLFGSVTTLEYLASWRTSWKQHALGDVQLPCNDCWRSSDTCFNHCRKCWLGTLVDDPRMLISYYLVFMLSCFKFRADRLSSFSVLKTYQQMMSRYKNSSLSDLSFETKCLWTILDYLRLYSYCHLLDLVLALILITGTLEFDILHLGYLGFALVFFRMRLEILKRKNEIFKFLRMYNFALIVLSLAYQSPFAGDFCEGNCETIDYISEVVGFHKYDYGFRITSRSALVEIIIFMLVALQSFMFAAQDFDHVSRYLEAEQIDTIINEQEKRAAWKTAQLHQIRKSEEQKRLRNLQVEKMKSEMLNLQTQLHSINTCANCGEIQNEGIRQRRNSSLNTDAANSILENLEINFKKQPGDISSDLIYSFDMNESLRSERFVSSSSVNSRNHSMDFLGDIIELNNRADSYEFWDSHKRDGERFRVKRNPLVSVVHLFKDGVSQAKYVGKMAVSNLVTFFNIKHEEPDSSDDSSDGDIYYEIEDQNIIGSEPIEPAFSTLSDSVLTTSAYRQIQMILLYMWDQMRSNNDIVCYCCFVLIFLWNFSLLSMVYPAVLFLYALCVNTGPLSMFWVIMLIYTEMCIFVQYLYQIIIQHCGLTFNISLLQELGFPAHKTLSSFVISNLPLFLVYLFTLLQTSITARDRTIADARSQKRNNFQEEGAQGYMGRIETLLLSAKNVLKLLIRSLFRYWKSLTQGAETPPYFVQVSMKVDLWPEDGIQPERIKSGINKLLEVMHNKRCQKRNHLHSVSNVRVQSIERSPENDNIALAVFEVLRASPLTGCTNVDLYKSLTPAADVAYEILEAQRAGIVREIRFPYTILSVIGGGKKDIDLYAYVFCADLAVFFLVAIFYHSVIKNNSEFLEVYQLEDQFPKEFVFILMVIFFLIVLDRVIYLCSFATGKVLFYLFNLALFTYSVTEYAWYTEPQHRHAGRLALRAIYLTKAISLALQAIQIRFGVPHESTLYRQFLTSSISRINHMGFRVYRALPFLYELRCVLDWSCTTTSLTMYDWLKLEDIHASLFLVKCDAVLNREKHRQGEKQPKRTKFCNGICLFFVLLCVIWTPMLMYSSGNPTNIANPIKDASIRIDIKTLSGRLTLFETTLCEKISWDELDSHDDLDPQGYLSEYNEKDIQLICCQADASTLWHVPPVVQTRYMRSLRLNMDIIFSWQLTRDRPKGKEVVRYELIVQDEDLPTYSEVMEVLNGTTNSFRIFNVYPRYFRVTGSGEVRLLEQSVDLVSGDLVLNRGNPEWWSFHDIDLSSGCGQFGGPMAIIVSEETPQGILGETLSKFSIWGLYITFVLAVGRFIRLQCADLRMRIPFENLPSCDRLMAICEDIYAARAEGELEVEEVLYWTLVKIYRSPHMLLEYTKPD
ncbi:piezo-type mechanosensitive ion channel [Salix suchowensis]|nr:piezo-type mechanosensitive ion channel [Salix suchowensis]